MSARDESKFNFTVESPTITTCFTSSYRGYFDFHLSSNCICNFTFTRNSFFHSTIFNLKVFGKWKVPILENFDHFYDAWKYAKYIILLPCITGNCFHSINRDKSNASRTFLMQVRPTFIFGSSFVRSTVCLCCRYKKNRCSVSFPTETECWVISSLPREWSR